jgi:hypothetical protein
MNHDQIEQYLAGRMSESEARAFEDHCVANPELARQVELEQRLKAGIAHVARGSTAEFVRSNHPMRWQMAAAAAGIVLSLFTLFYVWNRYVPQVEPAILAAVSAESRLHVTSQRLALVRGAGQKPALRPGLVRVEIAGLFDPGFHYSIELERLDVKKNIESVATLHGVRPTSPVTLEVMVNSDRLPSGAYSLRVRKQTSVEEPLDFEFLRN